MIRVVAVSLVLLLVAAGSSAQIARPSVIVLQKFWQRQDRVVLTEGNSLRLAASMEGLNQNGAYAVRVLWSGPPLSTPRGIVKVGDALYVADPGRSAKPGVSGVFAPARIVKFPVDGTKVGSPEVFFEDENFLINSKWIAHPDGREDVLYVSDQGRDLPGFISTGEGAKVFKLPILSNGKAGKPQVLHAGPPFVAPTGIAQIGPYVFVADAEAGPLRSRHEIPEWIFRSSVIFALPVTGGKPVKVWEGAPFTKVIGLCHWEGMSADGRRVHYLVLNDLNAGRINLNRKDYRGGSPEGNAAIFLMPILSLNPLKLGSPQKIEMTEEGSVRIRLAPATSATRIVVTAKNGTRFPNGALKKTFYPYHLTPDGVLEFMVASPVDQETVFVDVDLIGQGGDILYQAEVVLQKDPNQDTLFAHDKHIAITAPEPTAPGPGSFYISVDEGYDPGTGTIWLIASGHTPVALARGGPVGRPLAVQVSDDQSTIWVTDQVGALLEVKLPTMRQVARLFPYARKGGLGY